MDIYSWVKKHEKTIFISLTVLIGGAFLVTSQMLFVLEKLRQNAPAGYIFGEKVTKSDFYLTKLHWNNLITLLASRMYFPPTAILNIRGILQDDEIDKEGKKGEFGSRMLLKNKGVWKILILLKHAEERGVYITKKELEKELNRIFGSSEDLDLTLRERGIKKEDFLKMFKQYLIILRYVDYFSQQSKPGDLNKAFEMYKNANKSIQISYVLYKLKNSVNYLKKVSLKKKIDYVNKNHPSWNPKEKIKLRLIFYRVEDIKKTISKPDEKEKQQFYEDNKDNMFVEKTDKKSGAVEKTYKAYSDPQVQKKIEDTIIENKANDALAKKVDELYEFLITNIENIKDFSELKSKVGAEYLETDYFYYEDFSSLGLGYDTNLVRKELSKAVVSDKLKLFRTDKAWGYYQVVGKSRVKTPGYFLANNLQKIRLPYKISYEEESKRLEDVPKEIIKKWKDLVDLEFASYSQKHPEEIKNQMHELNIKRALRKQAFYKILEEYKLKNSMSSATFKYDSDFSVKGISFNAVTSKVKSLDIGESDYYCTENPNYVCIIFIVNEKIDPDPKGFIEKKEEYLEKSLFTYTKDQIENLYLKSLLDVAKLESKVPIGKDDRVDDYGNLQ